MCIIKSGFLFAASEYGNHAMYWFSKIGDEDEVAKCSAAESRAEFFMPRELVNL